MISEKELLNRIKENKVFLLGQVDISEEEYQDLLHYSRRFVFDASPAMGVKTDICLSITLVQVAIREFKEGRYWQYFCDAIDKKISSSKMNYCGKVFAATVKKLGLLYIDNDDASSQMYVENIKAHAIVTNYYMKGFWEFLSSYYEKNLFRQISDDLFEDIDLLSAFMKNTLDSSSDSIIGEEVKGHASKSYKLLKGTRGALAYSNPDAILSLLKPLLHYIDNYYYDSEYPEDDNRFATCFEAWCKEKETSENKIEKRKKNRLLASRRPYIHYDFNQTLAYLVIPSQKFRDNECEGDASVLITINGVEKRMNLDIYKSFGIYISEKVSVPIPSVFDDISINIESGITKKYKILSSDYRIINKNCDVIYKLVLGDNLLLTKKNIEVSFEGQTECVDYSDEYKGFDYYSLRISDDSIVHVGKRTVSIAGEYSEVPVFEEEISSFEVFDSNDEKLIVTRKHPTVSFMIQDRKIMGTVLVVNGTKHSINDIEKIVACSTINSNDRAITIDLEKVLPRVDGTFAVYIDVPDEKTIAVPKYVRLEKMDLVFNKSIYSAYDEIYLWVKNKSTNIWPDREDVSLVAIGVDSDEYQIPIVDNADDVTFHLHLNEEMIIKLPLKIIKTGFSLDELSYSTQEYIWYSNLQESLYCSVPDVEEIRVYLNHDKDNYVKGFSISRGLFRVDISELKQKITGNIYKGWEYINILCIGAKKNSFLLYSVLRVMWVEPYFDFKMLNGHLCFDSIVKGDAKLVVDIEDEYTKEKLVKDKEITSGIIEFPNLPVNGLYSIIPKMVEEDEFGFNSTVVKMRPLFNQSYINFDDLTDCRLPIADLIFMEEEKPLSYEYNIDIRKKIDDNTYEGYMHGFKKDNRRSSKKRFGRVQIKVLENSDKCVFIQIYTSTYDEYDEDWIELYYDNEFKTLLHVNDNALSRSSSYDKFEFLADDETRYKVMKKKIRRLEINAV